MPLLVNGFTPAVASTPDHSSFNIANELDVRVRLSMNPWAPLFLSAHIVGQASAVAGDNAWVYSIHPNQSPRLAIYPDDQNLIGPEADAAITYPAGITVHWVRATCDFNNGSGNSVFNYYTSEDGTSWSQLGTANLTAAVVTMHNSTGPIAVPPSTLGYSGRVYYIEVRDGIGGTIVTNPDFSAQAPGTTSFNDSTGKTWTVAAGALDTGIRPQQIGLLA